MGIRVDDARQRLGVSRGARRTSGLGAMRALAAELRRRPRRATRPAIRSICSACSSRTTCGGRGGLSRARALPAPIPKLCTLVVASAFDAAIHDAYGKAFGVSCYETYGPDFMSRDLSHDLGPAFKGEYPRSLRAAGAAAARCRCFTRSAPAIRSRPPTSARGSTTGCPNTLEEWIARDGLIRFKIKLNGGNLRGRLRARRPHRPHRARGSRRRGVGDWKYLLDFNEGCPNVGYLLEFLRRVREAHARRASTASSTSSSRPPATCRRTAPTSCTRPRSSGRS